VITAGPALGNLLPYLILSQIAAQPMAAESDGDVNVDITVEVGSCPHILLGADPRLQEALGIETHDFPGDVSVVCPGSDVIEPLTNSIIMFLRDRRLRLKAPRINGADGEARRRSVESSAGSSAVDSIWRARNLDR
jgi:hypothetical protein